jgi:hypothetical protein
MNNQKGISTLLAIIVILACLAAGWFAFTRVTNIKSDENTTEAIDRAKENVNKAKEAGQKATDAVDQASEIVEQVDPAQ